MMKKWLMATGGLLFLGGLSLYVFIPSELHVVVTEKIAARPLAVTRLATWPSQWHKWWPQAPAGESPAWELKNSTFLPGITAPYALPVQWQSKAGTPPLHASIGVVPLGTDSTLVRWSAQVSTGRHPWRRWQRFRQAKRFGKQARQLLLALKQTAIHPEMVYGFKPVMSRVQDTVVLSTQEIMPTWPDTEDIYRLLARLEKHAARTGASITNVPMLNVQPQPDSGFKVMVGLPINRVVPEGGKVFIKRMIMGNLLTAEVVAGPRRLPMLFQEFEWCFQDMGKTSPAIPYQQIITNRLQQPDTSRWKTRFCYPVL